MVRVNFQPSNLSIEVEKGTTILEAARRAGVLIESPCNAAGTCGKCKVKVDSQSLARIMQKGEHGLSQEEKIQGYVLACQAYLEGNIDVEIIQEEKNQNLKILSAGKSLALELDSYIKKEFNQTENLTRVYAGKELLAVEAGDTEMANYGVVVDIGTTTVVVSLVQLNTGEELAFTTSLNPQSLQAQDVLSRIKFASEENGLAIMHNELLKEINRMIDQIVRETNLCRDNIYEAVFSGNTCMLHLAIRVSPYSLGQYPYTPKVKGGNQLSAANLGLDISQVGLIYLPPVISAYVGADITSGILATKLYEQEGVNLFVDIGTNGELVIGVNGQLTAASTAAGPAFEGMNIACGMRAGSGAIELFNVEENGAITIKTIGGGGATGICGSGLIDIVGELVDHGIIGQNGRLLENSKEASPLGEKLVRSNGKLVFNLIDQVFLSQKDIRQVQLAKGAIRAGIELLLKDKGLQPIDVDRVLIAGSFGYHLRAESLINIGLLPKEFLGKIEFLGNTSKSGGQAILLNQRYRKQMEDLVREVEVLELANCQDFQQIFVDCLNF